MINDIKPDTWAAVDGLGRSISTYKDVGDKKNKFVGMFYWLWHDEFSKTLTAQNNTKLIEEFPEAKNDYNHKAWQNPDFIGDDFFWNEPLYGYYSTTDEYVLRKHAELLADAGVDVLIFDCTNGSFLWEDSYRKLLEVFTKANKEGVNTPKIAFMLNFFPCETSKKMLMELYSDIYKDEKYKDLWFIWKGKPLIIAYPDSLNNENSQEKNIRETFTFRQPQPCYKYHDCDDMWGWLSVYPQDKYLNKDGTVEEMAVGVAQNWGPKGITAMNGVDVFGRSHTVEKDYSYSFKKGGITVNINSNTENSENYGLNFQEQWDYAIKNDPEFIFVTGWNEWCATRANVWPDEPGYESVLNAFPDQFIDEYSRDIEPTKGNLKDYYYYHLVENIRRFKGVSKPDEITEKNSTTIDIFGPLSQWDKNAVTYNHYKNSTYKRANKGYVGNYYVNNTMRNDILKTKVTFDCENVYFMVETVDPITSYTDKSWMRLFIKTDFSGTEKNWEGFNYIINRINPSDTECYIEKSLGGWNWEIKGKLIYSVTENILQIVVPKDIIEQNQKKVPSFNFKWSDNMQNEGDIMDFYINGDVAPGERFTFVFNGL